MSDINIQLPWWAGPVFVLMSSTSLLLLTALAIGAAVWVCLARESRAAWIVAVVIAIPWLVSVAGNLYAHIEEARSRATGAAYDRAHLRTLANDEIVSGMHLPAGTVLQTDERFQLSSIELPKPATLFGVPLAAGTVTMQDAKLNGSLTLERDATIDGLPCAAGAGVGFANGRLTDCQLSHPATIGGVPCRGFVSIHDDFLGCELAATYERYGVTWYAGTDDRGSDDYITFTVGSRAPSMRVRGAALPRGTMVVYRNSKIASITLPNGHDLPLK